MGTTAIAAGAVRRAGQWSGAPADRIVLDYDGRFLRRKRVVTAGGLEVMVDLAQATSLEAGDALELADGRLVEIVAAGEALVEVRPGPGVGLARLAWHIGNRHTPCQIGEGRLLIRRDPVLEGMLKGLGGVLAHVAEPFLPEGGAYGAGRTFGHDHGHDHAHPHDHDGHHGRRVHHHGSHGGGDGDEPAVADV